MQKDAETGDYQAETGSKGKATAVPALGNQMRTRSSKIRAE